MSIDEEKNITIIAHRHHRTVSLSDNESNNHRFVINGVELAAHVSYYMLTRARAELIVQCTFVL